MRVEGENALGFPCAAADLWDQQVNAEGGVLVVQEAFELGYLFPEHIWCVAHPSNDTQSTGIGDRCSELGASCYIHACEEDGMVDLEEVREGRAELFYGLLA